MRVFLLLISIVFFYACNVHHPSEKERLAEAIMKKVTIQLKNELELIPFGSSGQMMYQIQKLGLIFEYRKPLNIETGRAFLIAAVERFTEEVNANKAIRPYLDNYPFSSKNIEIKIFIQDQNGGEFEPGNLCILSAHDGILEYKIDDLKTKRLITIYKETYEEALEKLNHKKQSA